MTAISGTLTGTANSANFTPTTGVSDVIIDKDDSIGDILLMVKKDSVTAWELVSTESGSFSVLTPDTGLLYAFFSKGLSGTANYYMGP